MNLNNLQRSVGSALYRQVGRITGRLQSYQPLSVDVLEDETTYLAVFDAPGAEPDDIQVRYLDGSVKVQIDRVRQFHEGYTMQFPGRGMELNGEAELPSDAVVNPDAGTATLTKTGALHIEIPKAAAFEDETDDTTTAQTDTTDTETDGFTADED